MSEQEKNTVEKKEEENIKKEILIKEEPTKEEPKSERAVKEDPKKENKEEDKNVEEKTTPAKPKPEIENLPLNSSWTIWNASRKEKDHHIPYCDRLTKIAEFSTLLDFFHFYLYLKPVTEIERNIDIGFFKKGYKPLWESCPDSGCWLLRFKRTADLKEINQKWEKVLLLLVSEQFGEPHMLGCVLSIRGRETIIEIWFNYFKNKRIKDLIAEKFEKLVLGNQKESDSYSVLYFKDNNQSLVDKSTLRNADPLFLNKRKFTFK